MEYLFILLIVFLLYLIIKKGKSNYLFNNANFGNLNSIILLYLGIPILIFIIGWCKILIAIILSSLLIYGIYSFFKQNFKLVKLNKKVIINFIVIVLISFVWVYLSGIGGLNYQNFDHQYRNSIFNLLISESWPVILPPSGAYDFPIGLCYYIAIFLPAALFGKSFGLAAGYIFLYLWCSIGVLLTLLYLTKITKLNKYIVIILFIFFSGLDILNASIHGNNIVDLLYFSKHLEWSTAFQFSSNTTQLFWVYNQAIPTWLLTLLIINQKDNKYLGFIYSFSLLYCTLPAISLSIIVIYKMLFENYKKSKKYLKEIFSFENIVCGIPILLLSYLYLKGNLASENIYLIDFSHNIIDVIITLFCEVIIYIFIIFKYQNNNKWLYLTLIIAFICPFIAIGNGGDFCMRVSMPILMVLFILIIKSLDKAKLKKDWLVIVSFIIVFTIGSLTPINEIKRTVYNTINGYNNKAISLTDKRNDNFFCNVENNTFFTYIVKTNNKTN